MQRMPTKQEVIDTLKAHTKRDSGAFQEELKARMEGGAEAEGLSAKAKAMDETEDASTLSDGELESRIKALLHVEFRREMREIPEGLDEESRAAWCAKSCARAWDAVPKNLRAEHWQRLTEKSEAGIA